MIATPLHSFTLGLAFFIGNLLAINVLSQDEPPSPRVIRTADEVKRTPHEEAKLGLPIELHGVVTCIPEGWRGFFVSDESGGVYCEGLNAEAEKSFWPVQVGEEVQLIGITVSGAVNPYVLVESIKDRKLGTLLESPYGIPSTQTIPSVVDKKLDADLVRIRGNLVRGLSIAGEMEYGLTFFGKECDVAHSGFRIDTPIPVHSEVEVVGVVIPSQDDSALPFKLIVPNASCFKLIASGDEINRSARRISLQDIHSFPSITQLPIVRFQASLFQRDSTRSWLVSNDYGIEVKGTLPANLRIGSPFEGVGFVQTDGSQRWLEYTQILGPAEAESIRFQECESAIIHSPTNANRLIHFVGTLLDQNNFGLQTVLSFDADGKKVMVQVPIDVAAPDLAKLISGAKYDVSGLCVSSYPNKAYTNRIILRSTADLQLVALPPWPLKFTLYIVSFLSICLTLGLAFVIASYDQLKNTKQRLEGVQRELCATNESLEQRVIDRTDDLQKANAKLIQEAVVRLQAEQEKSAMRTRLEDAQSLAQLGSVYWDASTDSSTWSPQSLQIHGYREQDTPPTRQEYLAIVHPDDRDSYETYWNSLTATRLPLAIRYRIKTPFGTERWVSAMSRSLWRDSGQLIGIEGVTQDITELTLAEEQLRQSLKMDAIGRLAGGIAHDLNNTLTVIQMSCHLIESQVHNVDFVQSQLTAIQSATERSSRLTKQLLMYSRKQILKPTLLDVNDCIRNFVPLLKQMVGDPITIDLSLESPSQNILYDSGQFEQILMNLVVNARDAISCDGWIRIRTTNVSHESLPTNTNWELKPEPGNFIQLCVEDNGVGIPHETINKIFEPFYTSKPCDKGTGLGLAVIHGIVKQNQGGLRVESQVGKGTRFYVYLREWNQRKETLPDAPIVFQNNKTASPKNGAESVLVVDDERPLLDLVQTILERMGYRVLAFDSPASALHAVDHQKVDFDLLLTDFSMPGMTGVQLVQELRKTRSDFSVVFMSGFLNEEAFLNELPDSEHYFVQKPFTSTTLGGAIGQALNHARI